MIYIISGTSRSGKSLLAQSIMQEERIPYLSLDWLVMGFTNGVPEYGIHDKLWPNEIAEKLWPFLKAMLDNMIWSGTDYVIEGEAVLPELIYNYLKENATHIKICFLGYAYIDASEKLTETYAHSDQEKDWLINESKQYVKTHIGNMIAYSQRIEKSCAKYGMQYFDVSMNFKETLECTKSFILQA